MELFGKMELNSYLCCAKKERDGLRHQRYITQTGYRTLPEFAKKETLRIIPQQFLARQHDTVQLTYPITDINPSNFVGSLQYVGSLLYSESVDPIPMILCKSTNNYFILQINT